MPPKKAAKHADDCATLDGGACDCTDAAPPKPPARSLLADVLPPTPVKFPEMPDGPSLEEIGVDPMLLDAVRFDPIALESEFVRCAPDTAYWNTRYAQAEENSKLAELDVKRTEAYLQLKYRQRCQDERVTYTEAVITSMVALDDTLYEAKVRALRAEAVRTKLKGWCEAIRVKRDMLIQQGAHVREEMKGDPSLRAGMAGSAALNRTNRLGS